MVSVPHGQFPARERLWRCARNREQHRARAAGPATLRSELVKLTVAALKAAPIGHFKAKDILRSSQLHLLPADNAHVAADLAKVTNGRRLSPVLLVRGALTRGFPLQIADGYHRVCASYHLDENTDIPCRIADLPAA